MVASSIIIEFKCWVASSLLVYRVQKPKLSQFRMANKPSEISRALYIWNILYCDTNSVYVNVHFDRWFWMSTEIFIRIKKEIKEKNCRFWKTKWNSRVHFRIRSMFKLQVLAYRMSIGQLDELYEISTRNKKTVLDLFHWQNCYYIWWEIYYISKRNWNWAYCFD